MDQDKKDLGKWWIWLLTLTIPTILILTGMSYMGMWGRTTIERKVFESSYQKSDALISAAATFEAQLQEIQGKLRNPNLDKNTIFNLEATASSIRIQLNSIRRQQ